MQGTATVAPPLGQIQCHLCAVRPPPASATTRELATHGSKYLSACGSGPPLFSKFNRPQRPRPSWVAWVPPHHIRPRPPGLKVVHGKSRPTGCSYPLQALRPTLLVPTDGRAHRRGWCLILCMVGGEGPARSSGLRATSHWANHPRETRRQSAQDHRASVSAFGVGQGDATGRWARARWLCCHLASTPPRRPPLPAFFVTPGMLGHLNAPSPLFPPFPDAHHTHNAPCVRAPAIGQPPYPFRLRWCPRPLFSGTYRAHAHPRAPFPCPHSTQPPPHASPVHEPLRLRASADGRRASQRNGRASCFSCYPQHLHPLCLPRVQPHQANLGRHIASGAGSSAPSLEPATARF